MNLSTWRWVATLLMTCLTAVPTASAVSLGQIDTFEDGTTQGWTVGLLGASHPAPPVNVPDDGPGGVGDNYLQLTAVGGGGAGSRLVAINLGQWAGDYATTGINRITLDARNLGTTELTLRLYLENPMGGPPTDEAITAGVTLPAGGNWTPVTFALDPLSLTVLTGDVNTLLSNVTALRILHSPDPTFPGPALVASLGVDNIQAIAIAAVPEPPALAACGLGLLMLVAWRRGSGRARR